MMMLMVLMMMMLMMILLLMMMMMMRKMSRNDEEHVRHPFGQMDDMKNLTKHWPCAVITHIPGQHTVLAVYSIHNTNICYIKVYYVYI